MQWTNLVLQVYNIIFFRAFSNKHLHLLGHLYRKNARFGQAMLDPSPYCGLDVHPLFILPANVDQTCLVRQIFRKKLCWTGFSQNLFLMQLGFPQIWRTLIICCVLVPWLQRARTQYGASAPYRWHVLGQRMFTSYGGAGIEAPCLKANETFHCFSSITKHYRNVQSHKMCRNSTSSIHFLNSWMKT